MRALMRALAPSSFEDVAALVALYRPGPMAANMHNDYADRKNNRKPVEYFHPDAEELTQGYVWIDDLSRERDEGCPEIAGYTLAQADNLRKAMGKKIRSAMEKERESFTSGMESMGYDTKLSEEVFQVISQFADYAFNKSHSYGYGLVAYQTAFLKAHYPVQYMAALMTSVKGRKKEDSAIYLNECRHMGLEVAVPDVNTAQMNYYPDIESGNRSPRIVYGLSAIRNVGEGIVSLLISERNSNGPFVDFYDFCERVDLQVLNRRAIEALIKAGAFDSLGHTRQGLLASYEQIIEQTVSRRREKEMGVMTLFEVAPDDASQVFDDKVLIPEIEFEKQQRLSFEKEMTW